MKFIVGTPGKPRKNSCYLLSDNWDDYTMRTLFELYYCDENRLLKKIGPVKIMSKGLSRGRVPLPPASFEGLDEAYCSLGQGQSYYEELMCLPPETRNAILKSLRDCVADQSIYKAFENEPALGTSLMRVITVSDIKNKFRDILLGRGALTPYHFEFSINGDQEGSLSVNVTPYSTPRTNVHVIIGRNGVGKTRLLSGIADTLTANDKGSGSSLAGNITFMAENLNIDEEPNRFTSLVTVVFSAFDYFTPIKAKDVKGDVLYHYVGLKKFVTPEGQKETVRFKSLKNLKTEFRASVEACLDSTKKDRWLNALEVLNSDPIISDYQLKTIAEKNNAPEELSEIFDILSSGHKIILLSITKLVELVDERTLVLIDEPETHLHPPLLSSYMRALSDLLAERNGVALIATHSPVVLQEAPASCVTIMDRINLKYIFDRPEAETFGENVGTLTRDVFKLEVRESGFHKMIDKYLSTGTYQQLLAEFNNQIGSEGRAVARSIEISKS